MAKRWRPKWRDDPRQDWARAVKRRDKACMVCGQKSRLDAHHIIPAKVMPDLVLVTNNGITLCHFHHVELHRARVEIELLPILWEAHNDGRVIFEQLMLHPKFRALKEVPRVRLEKYAILRVVPNNYRRAVEQRWPEFKLPGPKIEEIKMSATDMTLPALKRAVLALAPEATGQSSYGGMTGDRFYTVILPNAKGGRDFITGDRAKDTWASALERLEAK